MLNITNGDNAVRIMQRAGIAGAMLPWRDVLHEGPVPAGIALPRLSEIRAGFIAARGWGALDQVRAEFRARDATLAAFREHEEVALWFEHDLYDQLHVLQLLHWFSEQDLGNTRLSLMCIDEYLGLMSPERMAALAPRRMPVTAEQFELARRAWTAFSAPDPSGWQDLLDDELSALPYLAAAVVRHLEQYPSVQNGTNRTENTLLNVVDRGVNLPGKVFAAAQVYEESRFMGDTVFWSYLEAMTRSEPPLLELSHGGMLEMPEHAAADAHQQRLLVTDAGRQVLADALDWIDINGIDKWLGGVHLQDGNVWRWDSDRKTLVPPS